MEAANWFHFSVSGPEIEVMVGTIDIYRLSLELKRLKGDIASGKMVKAVKITPDVTHRFMLSQRGFLMLRAKVLEITDLLQKMGSLPTELPKSGEMP